MTKDQLRIAPGLALPLDVVTEATAIVATRGAGKSSASAVIVEEVFALGVQVVIFDRTGVYWGLRSNAAGDGAGIGVYVLGGPHGDVPLEVGAGSLIADLVVDSGHSLVLDLSDLSKSGAIKFAADFLERLYDRKARSRSTTLLILDEAHFYAPQTPRGGFKGDSARLMGAMEDVVGLGRSRGLGVVLTTQRTQALNKAILDLIETLMVMRMLSPRARDAVQDWIREKHEDDREGILSTLDSLPTGTAWVWSPLRGILKRVALRRIKTFDSYATPKPGETRAEPKKRSELDLNALGERMKAAADRAKADDPRELRKRIVELERALDSAPMEDFEAAQDAVRETQEELADFTRQVEIEREAWAAERAGFIAARDVAIQALQDLSVDVPVPTEAPAHHLPAQRSQSLRSSPPQPKPQSNSESNGNGDLTPARQRILDALAMLEHIRVIQPSKTQVALFAGASPTSGTFMQNLGTLRAEGMIDYQVPGTASLTEVGRGAADRSRAPSTQQEMIAFVHQLVGSAKSKIIDVLIDTYPKPLHKNEIAERVGVSQTSGTYMQNLGSLRSLGLIDYPAPGYAQATPILFLG